MRIVVTGGAGFMGSNFIRYLLARYPDYEVINLDKLTYAGNLANLPDVSANPRYTFIQGDIADPQVVTDVLSQDIDAVINYAAETHVDRSIEAPEAFLHTDVMGTFHLLEAVKRYGIARLVQISTDEVFGSIEVGEFVERSPFEPNSPYAASKAGGDLLCRAYHRTYGTPVVVTHSCNFFGPYQYPEKIIPLFITNLLQGKTLPLYGEGSQIREWIYTEDHCQAIDLLLHRGKIGEVYNIGTGDRLSNLSLTQRLLTAFGKDNTAIHYVADRLGHDDRYAINASKLRRELGFRLRFSFDQALALTIEWYKTHVDWWLPLKQGLDSFVDKD